MSLKKIEIDSAAKRFLLIAAGIIFVAAAAVTAKWGIGTAISAGATDIAVADLAAALAPADPQTHYAAAALRERTLELADAAAAVREFETAAALSPNNYLVWLALARAREATGDREGGRLALERAKSLAPNYSRIRWALGNVLLRQGKTEAAFEEMRAAAESDSVFGLPLVSAATQFYKDNFERVRQAVGGSPSALVPLSLALAGNGRFDEALGIWRSLDRDRKLQSADTGAAVLAKMVEAGKYTQALEMSNILADSDQYRIGEIYNGGFENEISMRARGPLDWRIADGPQPQIALTDGQRREGRYSLLMIFRQAAGGELRSFSQTIAVTPGAAYRFEAYYRSDLKTSAQIRWNITAADGRLLGTTEAVSAQSEWKALYSDFEVPADIDGVIIALARDGCAGAEPCAIAGNLWFDDISLRPR